MKISIVVASDINGVIGKDGDLPWRIPGYPKDLIHFRELTTGHHVLMGRKTFESIGHPLADRTNLVLSRNKIFTPEGVIVFENLGDAILFAQEHDENELMVIGGEQIYNLALPLAEKIYMTIIPREFEGDTHFPKLDEGVWRETGREENSGIAPVIFRTLERR